MLVVLVDCPGIARDASETIGPVRRQRKPRSAADLVQQEEPPSDPGRMHHLLTAGAILYD